MKYTLMIAEDEKVERQALRLAISRNFPDLEILDDAINGIDMIRKVESREPDIIITDIEMPGINGLDALETLRQKGFCGKIIVQTAYSNFDYARQALSLDAESYLLKPIKQEALITLLAKTLESLKTRRSEKEENDRYRRIFSQMRPVLDQELIFSIQLNEVRPSYAIPYLRQILSGNSYSVLTFRYPQYEDSGFLEIRSKAESVVPDIIRSNQATAAGALINGRQSFIISHRENNSYRSRLESIDAAERCLLELGEEISLLKETAVGIGRMVENASDLAISYNESILALNSVPSSGGIQHFGDLKIERDESSTIDYQFKTLLTPVLQGDTEQCITILNRIKNESPLVHCSASGLKENCMDSLLEMHEKNIFIHSRTHRRIELMEMYLKGLGRLRDPELIFKWYSDEIIKLSEYRKEQSRNCIHECVKKAQEYILKNFMREISLDLVAEEIGISPYHLSHLFKQELDQNYIKYLTSVRMDHATKLINQGDYSLQELSRLSGYNNPGYFLKVYQKQIGANIKEINGICRILQ